MIASFTPVLRWLHAAMALVAGLKGPRIGRIRFANAARAVRNAQARARQVVMEAARAWLSEHPIDPYTEGLLFPEKSQRALNLETAPEAAPERKRAPADAGIADAPSTDDQADATKKVWPLKAMATPFHARPSIQKPHRTTRNVRVQSYHVSEIAVLRLRRRLMRLRLLLVEPPQHTVKRIAKLARAMAQHEARAITRNLPVPADVMLGAALKAGLTKDQARHVFRVYLNDHWARWDAQAKRLGLIPDTS